MLPTTPTTGSPPPDDTYNFTYTPHDGRPVRILIIVGLLLMGMFLWVYGQPENWGYSWLYWLLTISVVMKLLRLLHEWIHYWRVVPPTPPPVTRSWRVDVLTTFCPGEPYDMLLNTLRAIQAMPYPHTTYLCDETNDSYLQLMCGQLGVRHVSRYPDRTDAKAGNINYALREATGNICLILDPDHVPVPDFLDRVLPYFEDPAIGFVQCVQAYANHKESLVAFGAAEQTYTFYGPMMTCMGNYGTAQAIGANCTFRRAALDSIGGHAPGLAEDMHTAMRLHASGWQSVYVPEPLSYGLVPSTLSAYYKQQLKWARGTFELLVSVFPRVVGRLSWPQRLHYLTLPLHYLLGVTQLIDLLIPIFSLVLMRLPLRLDLLVFASAYVPLLLTGFLIRQYAQRWLIERHEAGFHVLGGILSSGTWWVYVLGFIYTIFRVDVPYLPTPKHDRPRNHVVLCLPNLLLLLLTGLAMAYSTYHYGRFAVANLYSQLMLGFGLLNMLVLGINVLIAQERLLWNVKNGLHWLTFHQPAIQVVRVLLWQIRYGLYRLLRRSAIPLFFGLLLLTTSLTIYTHDKRSTRLPHALRYATTQPFYYGVDSSVVRLPAWLPTSPTGLPLAPQRLTWSVNNRSETAITSPNLDSTTLSIPLLYLEPAWKNDVNKAKCQSDVIQSEKDLQWFLAALLHGQYDAALQGFEKHIRRYGQPVLVCFAPRFDDNNQRWGTHDEQSLLLYQKACRYVAGYVNRRLPNTIIWLWCPAQASTILSYYPGDASVDWLGINGLAGSPSDEAGIVPSFAALYQVTHSIIRMHPDYSIRQKPILLTHLRAPTAVRWQQTWLTQSLTTIRERYPEIKGIIFSPEQAQLSVDQ